MEKTSLEVRVPIPAAAVADDKLAAASPPPTPLWWRALCFLALRVADAVFGAMCAALSLVSVGSALTLLGRRIGGSAGASVAKAGSSVCFAGACLYPFIIVALPLYVMCSLSSDKEPAPRRDKNNGSKLAALWGFLLSSDPVITMYIFYFLVGVGCLPELLSLEKGSFWEEAGSLVLCVAGVGAAVVNCCFVCPNWVRQWRSGQRNRANKKN